ncbi:MAG: ATP-binding protein [Candidatus Aenigmatarchaeota archaeon]
MDEEKIANIASSCIPPIMVKTKKMLLKIIVPKTNETHSFKNIVYIGVASSNRALAPNEIINLAQKLGKVYWDSLICEEATLKDIDEEKVRWFLRKAKIERSFDIDFETSVKEALERLGLIKNGKLTNAAILLFGKNPQKFFLQAETRCARFKGTKPIEFLDMKVFGGNIIDQIEKALNFVLEHISMRIEIKGKAEREEIYEYPPDAIREAIVNAICHRDYTIPSNVQVRIFDDRIEVWGCGPLPEPLKPEDLKGRHKSILRNPLIGRSFFLIKFIEEWGTGTNRMIEACLKHGIPEPEFDMVEGNLVVTFRKDIYTEDYLRELGLKERQIKAINYIKEKGRITRAEYVKLCGCSERTALNDLVELVNKNILVRADEGKKTYYILRAKRSLKRDNR